MSILSSNNSSNNNLIKSVDNAKENEHQEVLKMFQQVVSQELAYFGGLSLESIEQQLLNDLPDYIASEAEIYERQIKRQEARVLRPLSMHEEQSLRASIFTENLSKINFTHGYTLLVQEVIDIIRFVKETEIDRRKSSSKYNKKIIYKLRHALKNPVYHWLKYQESVGVIHFLHTVCLASYIEPVFLPVFAQLGEALNSSTIASSLQLSQLLQSARNRAAEGGLLKNDVTVSYIIKFFRQAFGAFLGTYWGHRLSLVLGIKPFDPRGKLGNNVGVLYQEKIGMNTSLAEIVSRTVYTPSPTVGYEVAPEAHAILQAMENRHFMKDDLLKTDPYPYFVWVYTNLQNLNSPDEKSCIHKLMQLNHEYPFSFKGITITQDSPFYRAGVARRSHSQEIAKMTVDTEELAMDYVETMRKELYQDRNFTMVNRGQVGEKQSNNDPGYYFPNVEWRFALQQITQMAYESLVDKKCPIEMDKMRWNWCHKTAYRELVHLSIIRYHQVQAGIEVMKKQAGKKIHILQSSVCKESMDRGGKTNACLLWALGEESPELYKQVFAAFHARALLSRKRLILADRMEPMLALTVVMEQPEINQFLQALTRHFLCRGSKATPIFKDSK